MTFQLITVGMIGVAALSIFATSRAAPAAPSTPADVHFQAHRGGLKEVPENTLAAFRHAWNCPGAIPEVDVCATRDGVMVCMHDDTPARTTTAPDAFKKEKISEVAFDELRQWDAGVKFDSKYAGEKVPALTEVFEEMKGRPEREAYLDLKDVDLDKLQRLIEQFGVSRQVIFVHGDPAMCLKLSGLFPDARTMTWLGGAPSQIRQRFEEMARAGFKGINQIQLHLQTTQTQPEIRYVFDNEFLRGALEKAEAAGAALQVRPFSFDRTSLRALMDLGIRWYVTDEPRRFAETISPQSAPTR